MFAVVVWGASFVATKTALQEMPPLTIIVLRFALGVGVLVAVTALRRELRRVPWREQARFAGLGAIGVLVHQMIQATGLRYTSATNTGWIVMLSPIFIAIIARITLGERLRPAQLAGITVAFTGALLVCTHGDLRAGVFGRPSSVGDGLILLSAVNWAVFSVLSKPVLRRHPAALVMTYAMGWGWLATLPVATAAHAWAVIPHISIQGWSAIAFLGFFCSGLAYAAWYDGLQNADASTVATFLYIEPFVTVLVAAQRLHERIGMTTILGGVVLLSGVALVQRGALRSVRPVQIGERSQRRMRSP